jgi:O-antigen/teichoic acid export membrane protein
VTADPSATGLGPVSGEELTAADQTRRQIRGSTLLVSGRVVAMVFNFAVQVLIVRYLTQTDYGAFAYALSIVHVAQTVVTFGLDRAVTRFIPIYEERGDYPRLFGTLAMVAATFISLGLGAVLLVFGVQGWLVGTLIQDPQAVSLIVILILLAPIQALDDLLIGLFAVFANAKAIFLRRYVLGPGLRLLVVVLLVLTQQQVTFLAAGYVLSGVLILLLYGGLLWRFMRRRGLMDKFDRHEVRVPAGEVLSFTIPLLTSDLLAAVMSTTDAILLGFFHSAAEVGALRVVLPVALLNQAVFSSFSLLYTPLAARLFARQDQAAINDLYWRTAIWIAVFSFPIFLLTFSLAEPVTVFLFEERYRDSAVYLVLLSGAMYFNAALGFNGLTLKVMGKLRYVVTLNIAAAIVNVGLNLLLIPGLGALGAAIATAMTLVAHNIFKQAGLLLAGVRLFEWRYLRVYLTILTGAVVVMVVNETLHLELWLTLALAGVASLAVFLLNREALSVGDMFPELLRVPGMRWLVGAR